MTSTPATDVAGKGSLTRGSDPVAPESQSGGDYDESALYGFLCGGLTAAQEAIEQTLARQQAMMDVVSRIALGPDGGGPPDAGPEEMGALVAALQSDDLICQELENLARVHAVMSGIVQEVLGAAEAESGEVRPSAPPGVRWTESLMKTLTLEDMRQRFTRHLTGRDRG